MVLSIQEAYNILDLRKGASPDEVVNSYKHLALEWHPDKHNQSELSFEKFSKINNAFRRLTTADDKEVTKPLAKDKMFQIFEEVYIKKKNFTANLNNGTISSGDDKNRLKNSAGSQLRKEKEKSLPQKAAQDENVAISDNDDVEKNEENLAADQEERRKNVEKRRAKKKRRKEAKKLEKELLQAQENKELVPVSQPNASNSQSSRSSSIDTDSNEKNNSGSKVEDKPSKKASINNCSTTNSSKSNSATSISSKDTSASQISKEVKQEPEVKVETPVVDPLILQSRRLATRGNELASDENFIAAVELYSEAIKINSEDFRFYGNRSYCYDKLGLFNKALTDAEKAIKLNPDWSKNYHRKGRALAGLKKFVEAEVLFETVLKMDKDCAEAKQELYKVRLQQLMEMGFTKLQAETAILQHKSVSAALDSLLQAPVPSNNWVESKASRKRTPEEKELCRMGATAKPSNDVYVSDDENRSSPPMFQKLQQQMHQLQPRFQQKPIIDIKLDPNNPEGLNSLWVGNIPKDVEESALKRLFSPYGIVVSVKKKPDTYYAFVEYADKSSAGIAMRALQGYLFGSQKLYIRFPGKTANNAPLIKNPPVFIPSTALASLPWSSAGIGNQLPPVKLKGPVNGNECYFWRTTGCSYGDKCKFKHIQAHKGIDRRPWQTSTA